MVTGFVYHCRPCDQKHRGYNMNT